MKFYKSRDVERLTGLASATLRNWRGDGFDYDFTSGEDRLKDHTYTRRGLMALAIAKQARDGGCSVQQAHYIGFWAIHDIARLALDNKLNEEDFADLAWMDDKENQCRSVVGYVAHWAIFAPNDNMPMITNDLQFVAHKTTLNSNDTGNLATVVSLGTIADRLPKALIEELCR